MKKKDKRREQEVGEVDGFEEIDEFAEYEDELGEETPEEELTEDQKLAADYKRKWYAVSAEYENYRKRNAASVAKAYSDGIADAVLKLLPVSDTFGYALASAADEKTRDGIEKVIKNFNAILSSFGIEEIAIAEGDTFDETVAEAIMPMPCGEGEQPNVIKNVLKKGYRQGDKVIRFAQVAVTV